MISKLTDGARFADIDGRRVCLGSHMGRQSMKTSDFNAESKFYLRREVLNAGGYDSQGAYWGGPDDLWRAEDQEGQQVFLRAASRREALAELRSTYPGIQFLRSTMTPEHPMREDVMVFLATWLWLQDRDDDAKRPLRGLSAYNFSVEMVSAVKDFLDAFLLAVTRAELHTQMLEQRRHWAGTLLHQMVGSGCGFFDDSDAEELDAFVSQRFIAGRRDLAHVELNVTGLDRVVDLGYKQEYLDAERARVFAYGWTVEKIEKALAAGKAVYVRSRAYEVRKGKSESLIWCEATKHGIGLLKGNGDLNAHPTDFFTDA